MNELTCILLTALFIWAWAATLLALRAASKRREAEREISRLLEDE